MAEEVAAGLWWSAAERAEGPSVVLGAGPIAPGEPLVALRRVGARWRTGLLFLGGERAVDVSFHPAAIVSVLAGRALRDGRRAAEWSAAVAARLASASTAAGGWAPAGVRSDGDLLTAVLCGLTHPLLVPALDGGAAAPGEVPRWASGALGEPTARRAAEELFGAAATRPVVRALGALMGPPAGDGGAAAWAPWWSLALAVALTGVCEPDRLAVVLSGGHRTGERPLPSTDDVAAVRRLARLLGDEAAVRLAVDALSLDVLDGPSRLVRAAELLTSNGRGAPTVIPRRVAALEETCLALTPLDPDWTVARAAPELDDEEGPVSGRGPFRHPPQVAALQGVEAGSLTLEVPRTGAELRAWGQVLHNCLSDFEPAVHAGRSVIVGVRREGRLVAALELDPVAQGVRQFLATRNRRPRPEVTGPVFRELERRGLIDHHPDT